LRFIILHPFHITLVFQTTSLTHVVTYSCQIPDKLALQDIFLSNQNATDHNNKNAGILKLIELVREVHDDGNQEDEKYSELFESHESSEW
jgi:hypothetical protein